MYGFSNLAKPTWKRGKAAVKGHTKVPQVAQNRNFNEVKFKFKFSCLIRFLTVQSFGKLDALGEKSFEIGILCFYQIEMFF